MAETKVKLSVCMPVYNSSRYISKSIESVLAQTYKEFNLYIFDNCSTDNTGDIVNSYTDPRIKYFRNENNLGLVGNHQRCIDFCETEYLNIWHDDDIMMPENLEKKMAVLDNNRNVGLVFSNLNFIDENDNLHNYKWNEECQNDFVVNGKVLFEKYIRKMHIGAYFFIGSVISRKEVLNRAGGFNLQDSHLICDSSLWLRSLLLTDAACIGAPLVKYRSYQGSACSGVYGVNFLKEHFDVVDRTLNQYQDEIENVEELRKEVERNFIIQAAHKGTATCGKNDFQSARMFMEWINDFPQKIVFDRTLMGFKARLALGPEVAKIYRPLKKKYENLH